MIVDSGYGKGMETKKILCKRVKWFGGIPDIEDEVGESNQKCLFNIPQY